MSLFFKMNAILSPLPPPLSRPRCCLLGALNIWDLTRGRCVVPPLAPAPAPVPSLPKQQYIKLLYSKKNRRTRDASYTLTRRHVHTFVRSYKSKVKSAPKMGMVVVSYPFSTTIVIVTDSSPPPKIPPTIL